MTLQQRIAEAKQYYFGDDDKQIFSDIQKDLKKLAIAKDYAKNDATLQIVDKAWGEIRKINLLLAYDDDLDDPAQAWKRSALKKARDVHRWYIGVMIPSSIDTLEKEISDFLSKKIDDAKK